MAKAGTPPLEFYRLVGRSGTATITGNFVDSYGLLVGDFLTYNVTTDAYHTLAQVAGSSIPANAVGFVIAETSANLVITTARSDASVGTLADAKTRAYYHAAGTRGIGLGAVS